ncbi:related to COMPASS component SWD1 [Hanseniaspora guilliermondii]|uniref:Related to COMPASS component SWD1 n=1 Tax=Hanseniaspora guilliermondii TaxID=56406 RepID=A0A1L0B2I8_9ASCO|nr:related to COMPASS component SWD1 [Hanseniaspora guilliermondii]
MSINLLLHDPFCVLKDYPEHYAGIINTYPFKAVVQRYNPTGDYLASGCKDGSIIIYDMDTQKLIMYLGKNPVFGENNDESYQTKCLIKNHQDEILSVEWSHCGRYLLSAGKDNVVKIWDLACNHKNMVENTQLIFEKRRDECCCKSFDFDTNIHEARFIKSNQDLVIVCTKKSCLPLVIDVQKNTIESIHKYFDHSSLDGNSDSESLLNEILSNEKKYGVATSSLVTDKKLFVGSSKGWCFVYNISENGDMSINSHFKTSSSSIKNLLINNSMDTMYINSADRVIRQFDVLSINNQGKVAMEVNLKHKYQDVINRLQWNDIILSPHNGDFLAASANGANKDTGLFLWDTINGSLVKIYENSGEQLYKIDWDPNNMSIAASGCESGDIFCWEVSLPPKWASLAPDFEEVDEQVKYIEQEDEFDEQDNDYLKRDQNKFETEIKDLDLVTPDRTDVRGNVNKSHSVFKIPTNYSDILRLRKNIEQ